MKTEKIITLQAKDRLKGNRVTVISAFLFICAVLLCLNCLQSIALVALDTVNLDSGEIRYGKEFTAYASDVLLFLSILLLSPLLNGFIKICYSAAQNIQPQMSLLFGYFKSPALYFKTVLFNLLPLLIISLGVYEIGIMSASLSLSGIDLQISEEFAIILLNLISLLIKTAFAIIFLLIFFLFIHYALFLYADNCEGNIIYYYSKGIAIALRHFGSTVKLFFHFIGWILLCFFVVPAFYVIPYYAVSFAVSAKWLISLEKGRNKL